MSATSDDPPAGRTDASASATDAPPTDTEWFGDTQVARGAKKARVRGVFDSVASRYDLMNDLMSGGVHRIWKSLFVAQVNPRPGEHILDVAGGTGDIAFRLLAQSRRGESGARITVCDINRSMLSVGQDRALDRGYLRGLDWVCGDAERLPFPDRSMNAYTIAFGLRNVSDIPLALREARRVLKPGGRFFCLEFSRVALPGLDRLYDAYSFKVLPRIGGMVTGDRAAYQYLAESIRRFPDQSTLESLMRAAGFARVSHTNLSGGITAIHTGWRL